MNVRHCPHPGVLQQYALGKLTDEQGETVVDHVTECDDCRSLLAQADGLSDELLAQLRRPVPTELLQADSEVEQLIDNVCSMQDTAHTTTSATDPSLEDDSPKPGSPWTPQLEGTRLGEYNLLEKIGAGGMGSVYRAVHRKLKREVALKVLPPHLADNPDSLGRFHREMEAVGKLRDPHIVQAYDAGEDDGTHYLVMEYVDGKDLAQLVKEQGPLPVQTACDYIRQAALGLAHAHDSGLTHRDIKPSNLFVSKEGTVQLLDLGLARLHEPTEENNEEALTHTHQLMGTADYMAPEQWLDTHNVDHRADIYSLGCSLYHLLAGRPPFVDGVNKTFGQKMMAHCKNDVPDLRRRRDNLPEHLLALITEMVAKKPEDRPQSAEEVAQRLAALLPTEASSGTMRLDTTPAPRDKLTPSTKPPQKHPSRRLWWIVAAALLLTVGVAAKLLFFSPNSVKVDTPHGTLVIETNAKEIEVIVKKDGKVVLTEKGTKRTFVLEAGEGYEISVRQLLDGKPDGVQATVKREFTLTREGKKIVQARFAPPSLPPGNTSWRGALVEAPSKIKGLLKWTVDTIYHRGLIQDVSLDPKGRYVATAGAEGSVRIWTSEGKLYRVLMGHGNSVDDVEWSPDGSILASCSYREGKSILWHVERGIPITEYEAPWVMSLGWSPTGSHLAQKYYVPMTGRYMVRVHNIETKQQQSFTLQEHSYRDPLFGTWGNKGSTFVLRRATNELVFYDPDTGKQTGSFDRFDDTTQMQDYKISADGRYLAVQIGDKKIDIWDLETKKRIHSLDFEKDKPTIETIKKLDWHSDSESLIVTVEGQAGNSASTKIIDTTTGKLLFSRGHHGLSPHGIELTQQKRRVLCSSFQHQIYWVSLDKSGDRSFTVTSRQSGVHTHEGTPIQTQWNPVVKSLAMITYGSLKITELHSGNTQLYAPSNPPIPDIPKPIFAPSWTSDGRSLFVGAYPNKKDSLCLIEPKTKLVKPLANTRYFWFSRDRKQMLYRDYSKEDKSIVIDPSRGKTLFEIEHPLRNVDWSPSGTVLAGLETNNPNKPLHIRDTRKGTLIKRLTITPTPRAVSWSFDGKYLAILAGHRVALIDGTTHKEIASFDHAGAVADMAWAPKSNLIATTGQDKAVVFWNAKTRVSTRTIARKTVCKQLVWSPDGAQLALCEGQHQNRVTFIDVATGKEIRHHLGNARFFEPPSWSADSKIVLLNWADGVLDFLDSKKGTSLGRMVCFGTMPDVLTVSPKGYFRTTSPDLANKIVYIAQTPTGQRVFTPKEFAVRYNWRNLPHKVTLAPE